MHNYMIVKRVQNRQKLTKEYGIFFHSGIAYWTSILNLVNVIPVLLPFVIHTTLIGFLHCANPTFTCRLVPVHCNNLLFSSIKSVRWGRSMIHHSLANWAIPATIHTPSSGRYSLNILWYRVYWFKMESPLNWVWIVAIPATIHTPSYGNVES